MIGLISRSYYVIHQLYISLAAHTEPILKVSYLNNESEFRWALLGDQMAFDKLHEGIRKFADDGATLKGLLRKRLQDA